MLTGAGEAVVVRVYGDDLDVIESKAHEIEDAIARHPRRQGPHTDLQTRIPHLVVQVDLDKAQAVGLKPGDVRRQAAVYLAARSCPTSSGSARPTTSWCGACRSPRRNPDDVRDMLIDTPSGGTVRLADIASVEMRSDAEHDPPDRRLAPPRRGRQRRRPAARRRGGGRRGSRRERRPAAGLPDRGHRRGHGARSGRQRLRLLSVVAVRRDPRPALRLVPPVAARRAQHAHPPDGPRRRGARGVADERHDDHRLVRRPVHGPRHRRP